jgi:hypothetical protein
MLVIILNIIYNPFVIIGVITREYVPVFSGRRIVVIAPQKQSKQEYQNQESDDEPVLLEPDPSLARLEFLVCRLPLREPPTPTAFSWALFGARFFGP